MTLLADEGIILRALAFGESDKLVTWYGPHVGKITAIAKGAQKSKKRFCNKLEAFSCVQLSFRPPRSQVGLSFLEEAELLSANLRIRHNHLKYVAAMYVAEIVLRFTKEHDPDQDLYNLLKWATAALELNERFLKIPLFFHLQLLGLSGYRPEFTQCSHCDQVVTPRQVFTFSLHHGAILCANCQDMGERDQVLLSIQTCKMLAHAQDVTFETLRRIQPAQHSLREGLNVLHAYSQYLLQTDLHTWRILRDLLQQEQIAY